MKQPTFYTERLILRPFAADDAPDVVRLAGTREIASTTLLIPHPYELHMAEEWLATHREGFEKGEMAVFAITHRAQGHLIGTISIKPDKEHESGELGYWIGADYWGNGYCTEAAKKILEYGFDDLGLNRIQAYHFGSNPASGRVMKKIGMTYEGCQRQGIKKWGKFEDRVIYGILRNEY